MNIFQRIWSKKKGGIFEAALCLFFGMKFYLRQVYLLTFPPRCSMESTNNCATYRELWMDPWGSFKLTW